MIDDFNRKIEQRGQKLVPSSESNVPVKKSEESPGFNNGESKKKEIREVVQKPQPTRKAIKEIDSDYNDQEDAEI